MRMSRFQVMLGCCMALILAVSFGATSASADDFTIDFDSQGLTGPSTFSGVTGTVPQQVNITESFGTVTFNGGVILTNTSALPADSTSVYGTEIGVGLPDSLTIVFPDDVTISNFSLSVFNGLNGGQTFTVSDGGANTEPVTTGGNFDVASNFGEADFNFANIGNTITITNGDISNWDYFIDNISFTTTASDPTGGDPTNTPEPATITLLGAGLAGIAMLLWRRGSQVSELVS